MDRSNREEPGVLSDSRRPLSRRKLLAAMGIAGASIATAGISGAYSALAQSGDDCVIAVPSVADLLALDAGSLSDGQLVRVLSVYATHPGGEFVWKASEPKSHHNAGMQI